jgi:hypothetical protein
MRVTRKMLNDRVEHLNRILNRPRAAYTKQINVGGTVYTANEGHFKLEAYSPGDGWTRYTLAMMVGANGGEINVSPSCTAQEMLTYLRGCFDVLDSVHMCDGGKHTFAKW